MTKMYRHTVAKLELACILSTTKVLIHSSAAGCGAQLLPSWVVHVLHWDIKPDDGKCKLLYAEIGLTTLQLFIRVRW
ncbi:hypothetical protein P389DRAFT_176060 [Cystobasidium minutum MCA 4210]|uniref:uncharacterized protein n=1 Tax=Cystobasidium minutum MCA 4210 TaxID=1397322 RepID=UPI0034CEFD6E|eukprot:jgi/Rhomi1/176060/fgenesh1_kg.12_\